MKKIILVVIFSMWGCGTEDQMDDFQTKDESDPRPHQGQGVDAELQRYVDSFEKTCGREIGDVPVVLDKVNIKLAIGACNTWSGEGVYREVVIDEKYFDKYRSDETVIEMLVWHELGHCVLSREHDVSIVDGCPGSIMRPYLFTAYEITKCYEERRDYYEKELCGTKP
jgi:hypothetical protein